MAHKNSEVLCKKRIKNIDKPIKYIDKHIKYEEIGL